MSKALYFCLWLGMAQALFAQPHDLRFDHISVEQGLSNFSISDVVQDQQGFLWIATEEGLNKYDGYDFTVYKADPADSHALPNSFIGQLSLDRSGGLWINTGHLVRYNPNSDSFDRFERFFQMPKIYPANILLGSLKTGTATFGSAPAKGFIGIIGSMRS